MKRLVVTGAASGIGAAVVREALARGSRVAGIDLYPKQGDLQHYEPVPRLTRHRSDVSNADDISRTMQEIVDIWGAAPTALIHCAGIYRTAPAESLGVDVWEQTQAINVRGSFLAAQAAGRHMLADGAGGEGAGGSIVLLSSVAFMNGDEFEPSVHYAASKGAVVSLGRQLAVEWGSRGIRTNVVAPGVIDTAMTTLTNHPDETADFLATLPLRRLGAAEEVAAACLFLAGDDASYINGVVLPVDGGLLTS